MQNKTIKAEEQEVPLEDLATAYREMAADEEREREASEWSEGLLGDVADSGFDLP